MSLHTVSPSVAILLILGGAVFGVLGGLHNLCSARSRSPTTTCPRRSLGRAGHGKFKPSTVADLPEIQGQGKKIRRFGAESRVKAFVPLVLQGGNRRLAVERSCVLGGPVNSASRAAYRSLS